MNQVQAQTNPIKNLIRVPRISLPKGYIPKGAIPKGLPKVTVPRGPTIRWNLNYIGNYSFSN